MADWEINKPLGQCSGSGRKIEPGEEYYGALVETEEGLVRRDFSNEYWERERPHVYCFWKTKLAAPNEKRKLFISDDMLMAFFERLANETEAEKVNFRFVLALVLMRKRRLKYDSTKSEGGREIWRLKVSGDKDLVEVVNPHLSEEQIEQLTSQIGQILQADL
ncbi:MAG TPA: hypothetical protein PLT20_08520 [Sedimentisphaerales bacterium]|nr:hypothetical protein [Phycisphaerae bacterium]HON90153.1 hypothetical protein [Sedimentisphaerales bacterium]HQI28117.1 hypothetical protein [Sedimentisphaerales bacterium]